MDMQVMVQRAPEVSKPIIAESQNAAAAQASLVDRFTKEALQNEERVLEVHQTESEDVDEDGRGGAQQDKRKKRRREDREEEKQADAPRAGGFDVSI